MNEELLKGGGFINDVEYLPVEESKEIFSFYGFEKKEDEEEFDDSEKSYETIQFSDDVEVTFSFLSFNNTWMPFIALSVSGNYTIISYMIAFDPIVFEHSFMILLYVVFEFVNIVDITSSVMHFSKKDVSATKSFNRKNILWVIMDILSMIKVPITLYNIIMHKNVIWDGVLILTIYRLYRAAQYFHKITSSPLKQSLKYVLLKYTFLLYNVIHTFTCIWKMIGCFECQDGMHDWIDNRPLPIYGMCAFWSLATTTNMGVGGASERNHLEALLVIFAMLFNLCLMSGVFLGAFTAVQIEGSKRRSLFGTKLNLIINQQLKTSKISSDIRDSITTWYLNFWINEFGIHTASLTDTLPNSIQREVTYDKYFYALNQSHILRYAHTGLKRALAEQMHTVYYNHGDIISKQDSFQGKVLFLAQGVAQVVAPDDIESPIIIFGFGTCIGDSSMVISFPYNAHIIASSYCKVHILNKNDLWRTVLKYKKLKQTKKMFEITQLKLKCAKAGQIKKLQAISRKKVDKTLKLIKQSLKRNFTSVEFNKFNQNVGEADFTDMYILSKAEILIGNQDKIFISTTWPWVLYPKTQLLLIWEIIIFLYSLTIIIIYPYVLFYLNNPPVYYNAFLRPMAYVLFIADIILQCFTGVEDEHQNVTVGIKEIISRRCTIFSFIVDVMSVVPCEIMFMKAAGTQILLHFLECNHMLKIIRILRFVMEMSQSFKFGTNVIKILLYVAYLLYLAYFQGIIYYKISCPTRPCAETSWVAAFQEDLNPNIRINDDFNNDIIFVAMLYGLLILTGTGGRYYIYNTTEIATISVFFAIFIFLYAYLLADYSATLTLSQMVRDNFISEVSNIRKYMVSNNIRRYNISRMNMFLQTQWDLTAGVEVRKLMHDVPLNYYEKLNRDKYAALLRSVPLFKLFDKTMHKKIAGKIVNELYPPNEYVTYAGGKSQEMYIIENGFCELSSPGTQRVEKIIGPKSCFCIIDMFLGLPNLYSAKTLTNVSLIRISLQDLNTVMAQYNPQLLQFIESWCSDMKSSFPVQRLFINTTEVIERQIPESEFQVSFKVFTEGKLNALNLDFQKGWSGFNLVKYFLRRRTILPGGKFLYIYVIFHAVVAFFSCLLNPVIFIYACVIPHGYAVLMTVPLDLLNILDLYIRMHVCYYNNQGVLVTHPRFTAMYYITHSFAIDLVTSLPLAVMCYFFARNKTGCCFLFIKILKAYRIPNGFAYCKKDVLKADSILVNVSKYLLLTIIALNTVSAIMILISCNFSEGENGYMSLQPYPESWIYTKKFSEITVIHGEYAHPFKIYLLAVYFTILVTMQLGYGDVFIVQNIEVLCSMVAIITGYLWFTYILVIISNTKAIMNENLTKYQNHMRDLISFSKEFRIPKRVIEKSIRHFEYLWQRTHGMSSTEILEDFHLTLKGDCALNLYFETLSMVSILRDAEIYIFRNLGMVLIESYYLEDNNILSLNDIEDTIYIISRGEVRILDPAGNHLITLWRGAMFGNLDNVVYTRSMITATSKNTVDILYVKTSTFYDILSNYPQIMRSIQNLLRKGNLSYIPDKCGGGSELRVVTMTHQKIKEQRTQLTNLERFRMSKLMELLLTLISFISYLIIVYHAAFLDQRGWVITTTYILDLFHLLKLYSGFNTPYTSNLGEIINNRKLIKNRYIRQPNFYVDLFGLVPFEIISLGMKRMDVWIYIALLRLNRVVRVYNVHNFFKVTYDYLNVKVLLIKLCSIAVFSAIFIHTTTCVMYILACPYTVCSENSWNYDRFNKRSKCSGPYICAMYYTMSILSSSGYSIMVPTSLLDIIVCIITAIISKFVVSIFISDMAAIVRYYGFKLASYAERVEILRTYLINAQVSYMLINRIMKYVDELWFKWSGHQMPFFLDIGPDCLREEIKLYSFGAHIFNNMVFMECHTDFLRQLVNNTKMETYFIGDKICAQGDINNTMYFIHTGRVDVILVGDREELIVDILEAKDCFGLVQGLFPNTPHTHTYQSRSLTEIVTLTLDDWVHIMQFFPASKYMLYYMIRCYNLH